MKQHLLTNPLITGLLLVSTLGCSKKDDTPPAATGSYQVDGVLKTCQVQAIVRTSSYGLANDMLTITLVTTPQPASGDEYVQLEFLKQKVQSTNVYQLSSMSYYSNGGQYGWAYTNTGTTVQETSSGFTGTFSGAAYAGNANPKIPLALRAGTFANVRL